MLGYIPFLGGPTSQPPPTEAEMQELYRELDYHPQGAPATAGASTGLTVKLQAGLHLLGLFVLLFSEPCCNLQSFSMRARAAWCVQRQLHIQVHDL